jgi:predicted membrane protein
MRCRHPDHYRHRQQRRVVFGAFLVLGGVLALLGNLNVLDVGNVWAYWPLVLCAFGVLHLMQARHGCGYLFGAGLVLFGAALTLQHLGLVHHIMRYAFPALVILGGVAILAKGFRGPDTRHRLVSGNSEDDAHRAEVNIIATLSGAVLRNDSPEFAGGELSAVMGSIQLDLRAASMASEAHLKVNAVFGGIEILVPADWRLVVRVSPPLGGVEDRTIPPMHATKTLVLAGEVVMGGVVIRN